MVFSFATATAVGVGGFLGAVCRFYVGIQVVKYFPSHIPLATLLVNLSGSFLIGILAAVFMNYSVSDSLRAFLVTGFLGALTTYSTFALESYMLLNSSLWYGMLNIILNVAGTILFAALGFKFIEKIL